MATDDGSFALLLGKRASVKMFAVTALGAHQDRS